MNDEKYICFKREEFIQWKEHAAPMVENPPVVGDAVVIRKRDIFAPPALDMYANSILVALSLMSPDDPRHAELHAIADYFHAQASDSWSSTRMLPTL